MLGEKSALFLEFGEHEEQSTYREEIVAFSPNNLLASFRVWSTMLVDISIQTLKSLK